MKTIISHLVALLIGAGIVMMAPSCMKVRLIDSRSLPQYDASRITAAVTSGQIALGATNLVYCKETHASVLTADTGTRWAEIVYDNGNILYWGLIKDDKWAALRQIENSGSYWVFRNPDSLEEYYRLSDQNAANKGLVRTGDPRTARQSAQP
jgi:hypothetical protein